jgi:hypothetical protein
VRLAWSRHESVRIAVAMNPSSPPRALLHLSRWATSKDVLDRIPHNPSATSRVLAHLVKAHSALHPTALAEAVKHPHCPSWVRVAIAHRRIKSGHIAAAFLAASPATEKDLLEALYVNWPEPSVRLALAKNPGCPQTVVTPLFVEANPDVLACLARNEGVEAHLRVLAGLAALGQ